MAFKITDSILVNTLEGPVRPSDVCGRPVHCSDGSYRICKATPVRMADYWTLHLTNGMMLELEENTAIAGPNGECGLVDITLASKLKQIPIKYNTEEEIKINLEEVIFSNSGEFDITDPDFAKLSGMFATGAKVLKTGEIQMRDRSSNKYLPDLIDKFDLKVKLIDGGIYNFERTWIFDLLEACYGKVENRKGEHYISDDILLHVPNEWRKLFIKYATRCYSVAGRGDYTFMARSEKYLNDLAHLMQGIFDYRFNILSSEPRFKGDYTKLGLQTKFRDDNYKERLVGVLQGIKYDIPTIGWELDVGEDIGINISGFFIR